MYKHIVIAVMNHIFNKNKYCTFANSQISIVPIAIAVSMYIGAMFWLISGLSKGIPASVGRFFQIVSFVCVFVVSMYAFVTRSPVICAVV